MIASFRMALIVEGDGEVAALPVLIRRWFHYRQYFGPLKLEPVLNARGCGNLICDRRRTASNRMIGVENFVEIAARHRPDAILILLDADDRCAGYSKPSVEERLGPRLLARARGVASHIPIHVVVADPEYEAWFLAEPCRSRIAASEGTDPGTIEIRRDCKGEMRRLLGRPYEERTDQAVLSRLHLPMEPCDCHSYDRFLRVLGELTAGAMPEV